jgi:4-amino-4-deoxy-L-arabinose transferase-like glycosyltransferase
MGGGGPGGGTTFGGATGPLRLFNEGLGGQAGWLLGFAAVAIVALAVVMRLRRADARTGWLIATGGIFLTIAVAFSFAQGIFHPYYVAQLAPFTALLMGAGRAGSCPPTARRASARLWPWRRGWRPSCSSCTTSPAS